MERFGPAYAYAIGHALLLGLAVLLWQSFFWAGDIALVLKLAVAALAVLAYARPAAALLVVAGLVPLSRMFTISIWPAYPANATEALVLAFLVGWLSRTWRSSSRLSWPSAALTTPTLLFFGVVLASCIVQVAVLQV